MFGIRFKSGKKKELKFEMPNTPNLYKEIDVKVAGITHKNKDGSSRSEIASYCVYGEQLLLVPEPDNRYDANAIRIMTKGNEQLGYLSSRDAKNIKSILDNCSKRYSNAVAYFIESDSFENEEGKEIPTCTIRIHQYYTKPKSLG